MFVCHHTHKLPDPESTTDLEIEDLEAHPSILDLLVKKVEAECKGLPLALEVIASPLRGEPPPVCENAKKTLSRGQPVSEYHKDELLHWLETNIDVLDDESKQCFLDLGTFPKARKFSVDALLDFWVYTRGMEWQDAFVVLLELASRNLLNLTSYPGCRAISFGCASELSFSQHDVMRDLAFRANQDSTLKDQASKALFGLIHTGPMEEQNWCQMNFPEVEVLTLFSAASLYYVPKFLHTMPKYLDKGHDFPKLPKFHEFSLDRCCDLEELPGNIWNLIYSQKFSVTNCHLIQKLRDDFGTLRSLRMLRLFASSSVSMLPPSICVLQQLEFLDISLCKSLKDLPMEFDQLSNLKILDMRECSGLKKLHKALAKLRSLRCVIWMRALNDSGRLSKPLSCMPNLIVEVIKERYNLDWFED